MKNSTSTRQGNKSMLVKDGERSDSTPRQLISWWTEQGPGAIPNTGIQSSVLLNSWNSPLHDFGSTLRKFLGTIQMLALPIKDIGKATLSRELDDQYGCMPLSLLLGSMSGIIARSALQF